MTRVIPLVLTFALALGGCAGPAEDEGPEGPPLAPGGYRLVVDADRPGPGQFVTAETPDGIRFTTGPAGIGWRPADTVGAGDFRAEATFALHGAPVGYREAYGVFVGGRGLEGARPGYLYLAVRATGEFSIRRRVGAATETVVEWLPHAAVQRVSADGDVPVNVLAIEALGEETLFLVNGRVVFRMPTSEAEPRGVAGVRVDHRLDVLLSSWTLGPPAAPDTAASSQPLTPGTGQATP